MEFEKGIPKWDKCQKRPLNGRADGTYIVYKPSQEVFNAEPIHFDFNEICNIIEEYSYFNKGVEFIVSNAETKEQKSYLSKNGLMDFADAKVSKRIHKHPIHIQTTENDIDIEIILNWTTGKEKFYLFSNGGENENGGTPITGIKTALTNFFKKKVKDLGSGDVVRAGLVYICSVNLKNPIYDGQTKNKITNPELRGLAQRCTTQMLDNFNRKYPGELDQIVELLTKELKAEHAAEKARQAILSHEKEFKKNQKKKILHADKLRDARKLGQDSILLCVEGLSAGGSMSIGRDPNKYGILMLRGKAKNLLNCKIEDGLENEEVKLMLQALGIPYGASYDTNKLRYGKLAIATDADVDGSHIGLLILAMIHVLMPEFIKENRMYWLRTPIYKVSVGKKDFFYYTEEEFKNHPNGSIVKYKGLGQLSEQDLRESMFNDTVQRLEPITYEESGKIALEQLMGTDVTPRKEFVNKIDFSNFEVE